MEIERWWFIYEYVEENIREIFRISEYYDNKVDSVELIKYHVVLMCDDNHFIYVRLMKLKLKIKNYRFERISIRLMQLVNNFVNKCLFYKAN